MSFGWLAAVKGGFGRFSCLLMEADRLFPATNPPVQNPHAVIVTFRSWTQVSGHTSEPRGPAYLQNVHVLATPLHLANQSSVDCRPI
jgi:hypothetical protein